MAADARKNIDGVELRKCADCKFVFSAKDLYAYEDLFATSFIGKSMEDLLCRAGDEGLDKLVTEILHKTGLKTGSKMLDFGSGIGLNALVCRGHGLNVVAVEASTPYLEKLTSFGIPAFPSARAALEDQGPFDLVVAKDVLEHLGCPLDVLDELVACVKPGGYLYLRVPNVYAYRIHWVVYTKEHVNHFTPRILMDLCEERGLDKFDFIGVHDIRSRAGRLYHALAWPARTFLPIYHQISVLFRKR